MENPHESPRELPPTSIGMRVVAVLFLMMGALGCSTSIADVYAVAQVASNEGSNIAVALKLITSS